VDGHNYWFVAGHVTRIAKKFVVQKYAIFVFFRMYPLFRIWTPGQIIGFIEAPGL
jgi:hypothetical protein